MLELLMYNEYPAKRDKAAIDDTTMFQYITHRYLDSQFFGMYKHNTVKSNKNYTKCKSERAKSRSSHHLLCLNWQYTDFNAQDYVNYKYTTIVNNPRLTAFQYAVM
jgi:hypothetical protein